MGKVYAYLRVSTDSQNLMQQQNAINEYIKYKGLTITDVVGINHHLNRRNGELKDFFLPRYAK